MARQPDDGLRPICLFFPTMANAYALSRGSSASDLYVHMSLGMHAFSTGQKPVAGFICDWCRAFNAKSHSRDW